MEGFKSLSTSCTCNKFCQARIEKARSLKNNLQEEIKKAWQDKKARVITMEEYKEIKKDCLEKIDNLCICADCYADTMQKQYKTLREHLKENSRLLTSSIMNLEDLPTFNPLTEPFFRLESFGDIANETQLINYIRICEKNACTRFTIWSKNIHIFRKVFDTMKYSKPENLNIIISSPMKNKIANYNDWFIDSIFTVWTSKEKAAAAGVKINCMKKCKDCFLKKGNNCCYCFKRSLSINYVNELLKSRLEKEGGYDD